MTGNPNDAWITGIGIASSLGEGVDAHLAALNAGGAPRLEAAAFAPYQVHPLVQLDLGKQIAKKSDQRQMEAWQRIGVYAAGLALDDGKLARDPALLARTNLVVAAGSGERDANVDAKVLETIDGRGDSVVLAKEVLPTALRPTLFLAQLSNLLAGNISIVHNVTGSSRTFMGEEMAGISAIENVVRRIKAGQGGVFLVGAALNAEREDLLLGYELGCNLWPRPYRPVWQRAGDGGGFVAGSVGAFLVIEAKAHAVARGAAPYARISDVVSDRCDRKPGEAAAAATRLFDRLLPAVAAGPLAVLSGASGVEPVTAAERDFLAGLDRRGMATFVRAYGSALGHSVEAHFPAGVALAAMVLKAGRLFAPLDAGGVERPLEDAPQRALVTGFGHWRGEGLALLEPVR